MTLEFAGSNKAELKKIIDHYERGNDPEKLRAAIFLIENMHDYYSYTGNDVTKYDVMMDKLDSLHHIYTKLPSTSPIVQHIWDSIIDVYGSPKRKAVNKQFDCQTIKAAYLIKHIDWAFEVKRRSPWLRNLRFDNFCEFILPYRIGTEKLEDWQDQLAVKYKPFRDTSYRKDLQKAAFDFNLLMNKFIGLDGSMRAYPYDQSVSQMHKSRRGACKHLVYYQTMAMRSLGMPVAVDYSPLWGDLNRGHHWNVLLLPDGKTQPFDAASTRLGGLEKYPYRFSKVFRQTYASQGTDLPDSSSIPGYLLNSHKIDVTDIYTKAYNIEVSLQYHTQSNLSFATICTFQGPGWRAQDWGIIKNGKAYFNKMGSNLMYIVFGAINNQFLPLTNPFILDRNGHMQFMSSAPANNMTLQLSRKYPSIPSNDTNMMSMVGGRFQVANKKDFSDSVTIAFITKPSVNISTLMPDMDQKYRYVRYVNPYGKPVDVAEIMFYGKEFTNDSVKKLTGTNIGRPVVPAEIGYPFQLAFDNNLETFFSTKLMKIHNDSSWVGLDLVRSKKIVCIKYLPRSDTNFILEGDTYELVYWDYDKWVSLGKQVAQSQILTYENVPSNKVYLLHNLTRGKEERIFTYQNGIQTWW